MKNLKVFLSILSQALALLCLVLLLKFAFVFLGALMGLNGYEWVTVGTVLFFGIICILAGIATQTVLKKIEPHNTHKEQG